MDGVGEFWITRFVFQRALGLIYFTAFAAAVNQFLPLCGSHGLLPVSDYLRGRSVVATPSIFWLNHSDNFIYSAAWLGLVLSVLAASGISERFGILVSSGIWLSMWVLYLSFVNVGQTFYGFGWESLLLEAGFLAIFFGSSDTEPPVLVVWLLRWVLFRLMLGAGLIKIRGDECWRDLTCMLYHYETQPMPNPLSWFFHRLPVPVHKSGVLFNHFVELIVPLGYLVPGFIGYISGGLTVVFQSLLIISGNFSWLNFLSLALCVCCFDDRVFSFLPLAVPKELSDYAPHRIAAAVLTIVVACLSIRPIQNMASSLQMMNTSFDPLHLVNTYGAFGSITRERYEIIIEGTSSSTIDENTSWLAYEFKGKPGDIRRMPRQFAPYHLRLDWLMWFAAMGPPRRYPWFSRLMVKLIEGDKAVEKLLLRNPFSDKPPAFLRATLYLYRFTSWKEWRETGAWWRREPVGMYFPTVRKRDISQGKEDGD